MIEDKVSDQQIINIIATSLEGYMFVLYSSNIVMSEVGKKVPLNEVLTIKQLIQGEPDNRSVVEYVRKVVISFANLANEDPKVGKVYKRILSSADDNQLIAGFESAKERLTDMIKIYEKGTFDIKDSNN